MIIGEHINLRPVRDDDLEAFWEHRNNVADRGPYHPIRMESLVRFRQRYAENGFWTDEGGLLLIVDKQDAIVGQIGFFNTVEHLDEVEFGYAIFGEENRGKGYGTEALRLMTRYLFEWKGVNRVRLTIHTENIASRRIAEKVGYQEEGIARGAWFHRGQHHDVVVVAVLRDEFLATLD